MRRTGAPKAAADLFAIPRGAGTVRLQATAEALNAAGIGERVQVEALRGTAVAAIAGDQGLAVAAAIAVLVVGALHVACRLGCSVAGTARCQWITLIAGGAALAASASIAFITIADDIAVGTQLAAAGKVVAAALGAGAIAAGHTTARIAIGAGRAGLWHEGYTATQPGTARLAYITRCAALTRIANIARRTVALLHKGGAAQTLIRGAGRVHGNVGQLHLARHSINITQTYQYIIHIGQYHHDLLACSLASVGLLPGAGQEADPHLVRLIGLGAHAIGQYEAVTRDDDIRSGKWTPIAQIADLILELATVGLQLIAHIVAGQGQIGCLATVVLNIGGTELNAMVHGEQAVSGALVDHNLLIGAQIDADHAMRQYGRLYGIAKEIGALAGVGNTKAEALDALLTGTGQHVEEASGTELIAIGCHLHNGIGHHKVGAARIYDLAGVGAAFLVLHIGAIEIAAAAGAGGHTLVGHMAPVEAPNNCRCGHTRCRTRQIEGLTLQQGLHGWRWANGHGRHCNES